METAVEYEAAGNTPYSPVQVVTTAYHIFFQIGLFNENCKVWKRKADVHKTWANFVVDFATRHQYWRELQTMSDGGVGFQSASLAHQQDMLDAFVIFAT